MFQAPFSFEGRIRRTEYGISLIIYVIAATFMSLITESTNSGGGSLLFLLYIPMLWFFWAQGAKRCHDIDRNGWNQIIPFYFLWLIFQDSVAGENGYGPNPKGIGNEDNYDAQISEIGKSLES